MDITKEEVKKAVDQWGVEAQTNMMIEELGEFLAAWNHYKRGRITEEEYVSEIADVYIMIQQLRVIHMDAFNKVYPKKLAKIREKLLIYNNLDKDY